MRKLFNPGLTKAALTFLSPEISEANATVLTFLSKSQSSKKRQGKSNVNTITPAQSFKGSPAALLQIHPWRRCRDRYRSGNGSLGPCSLQGLCGRERNALGKRAGKRDMEEGKIDSARKSKS